MQINLYAEDEISMSEAVVDVLGIILDIMMPKRSGYGGASCPRPCNAPAQKTRSFLFPHRWTAWGSQSQKRRAAPSRRSARPSASVRSPCAICTASKVKCGQTYYTPIFVFDRGYPSKNLIAYVEDEIKAQYLFRLRSKFNNRIDGLPGPQSPDGIADCTINLDGRPVS